jgi:thiol-disulfide isomerase/thioredoxin
MKPIVDGIEEEFKGQLIVQRVNVQDSIGKSLAKKYGFLATPTFILFNEKGVEVWRSIGGIDKMKIAQFLVSN